MIHLVTDSTSDLSPERATALGVRVVPLTVRFGDEQFRDGVDLEAKEFYRRLTESAANPTTSQPPPQEFAGVYRELLKGSGDHVVSIHLSEKLSGTLQAAALAARDVDEQRVHVMDSETVSLGMQLLIEAARRDIDGGAAVAAVLGNLEARRRLVRTYFLLDTLTYVQRGGRIGRAQAFLGGILQVKPLIAIRDGEVQPQARVRSRRQGIDALTELARSCGDVEAIGVVHSAAPALGEQIRQGLRDVFPGVEPTCVELGPVVGTYAGPGGAGFSCMINGA